MKRFLAYLLLLTLLLHPAVRAAVPAQCTQAIIGMTDGWNSSHATLSVVEKTKQGTWQRVLGPFPGRLGSKGTVWGRGLHATAKNATLKKEGDGRSPAGVFALGGLWVTNATPVKHDSRIPLVKVGPNDLWVSDTKRPDLYNRYVHLDHPASTPWELKEQMRQTDYAHSIKMLICHNTAETKGRPVNGGGSSVFFHIWRNDGGSPTAGCTAMAETNLRAIISRLNPSRHPVYILLPREEYIKLRNTWNLP